MSDPSFEPPTPERFEELLAESEPKQIPIWVARAPLGILIAAILVSLILPPQIGGVLPWVALIGVIIYLRSRTRKNRELQNQARQMQELTMLRHHREALRLGWVLLPKLRELPPIHGRTVAMMTHCLDLAEAYDAAILGYDYLLERLPQGHPGAVQFRIQRAISALLADRLTDADDALRRLRNSVSQFEKTPLHAGYLLAVLIQDVRTHHFAEAIELADDWVAALRPLGIEAAYGHALVALCHHHENRLDEARTFWSHATTLLPAPMLAHRFDELKPLMK